MLEGIVLGIGLNLSNPTVADDYDGYGTVKGIHVNATHTSGMYAELGLETGSYSMVGQDFADISAGTFEFGYEYRVTPRLDFGIGVGLWQPISVDSVKIIEEEVAFTYLVNEHSVGGNKPIPLPEITNGNGDVDYPPCADWGGTYFPDQCYTSNFEMGTGLFINLRAKWNVSDQLELGVSYRMLRADSTIEVFHQERKEANLGWWREAGLVDISTVGVTMTYKF